VLAADRLAQTAASPIVLIPKNRGLSGQLARFRDRLVPESGVQLAVRGEDVPFLANEIARSGRAVVAMTGDDLLDEWLLEGNALDARLVRRRIAWFDPSAIYGAPALCLAGTSPEVLLQPQCVRVAVCSRYRRLVERQLLAMSDTGIRFEVVPIAGAVEACVGSGVADLIADIVVSGRTIAEAGLRVLRVISTSDVAILEAP